MDLRRLNGNQLHSRQISGDSHSTETSSPAMSPAHPSSRPFSTTGFSSIKRTQTEATKSVAQKLAEVMKGGKYDQYDDEYDDYDDDENDLYTAPMSSSSSSNYSRNHFNFVSSTTAASAPPTPSRSPALPPPAVIS